MTVRFFMLQSHYSSTLDFSNDALVAAEKGFRRLASALSIVRHFNTDYTTATPDPSVNEQILQLVEACHTCMSDDFNTAKSLAALFEMSARINEMKSGDLKLEKIDPETLAKLKSTYIGFMEEVLGLHEEEASNHELMDGIIQVLISIRKKAREDRNFALSDKIRDDLKALGVQLMDGKDGEISYRIGE